MIRRMTPLCRAAGAGWALAVALAAPLGAEPLDTFRDCDVCPEMIELPLGEFVMGAPDSEFRKIVDYTGGKISFATPENPYIPKNEGPQNHVVIDIKIAMGKNEITYDDWMACVNDGGCDGYIPDDNGYQVGASEHIQSSITDSRFKRIPSEKEIARILYLPEHLKLSGRHPVTFVSYLNATAYVAWLNKKLNTTAYRLPTEAEWEFAARAGTTTQFAQGYEPTSDQENINGANTAAMLQEPRPDLRTLGYPVSVDELDAANPWGLRHMAGNVGEITLSCYPQDIIELPSWPTASEWLEKSFKQSCDRVARGGSYADSMDLARPASRRKIRDTDDISFLGFRIVKVLN